MSFVGNVKARGWFGVVAAALLAVVATGVLLAARSAKWWPDNLGGPDSSAYVDLDQIKKSNVAAARSRVDLSLRVAGLQPDRRRRCDLYVGPQRIAHRPGCDDREGNLDPRRTDRHDRPRRQLLAERGRQGQAAAVLDQQLPAGDRREHRQVHLDLRHRRHRSTSAQGLPRGENMGWNPNSPGKVWKNLLIIGSTDRARRSCRRPATSAPTTSSPARRSGSSTRCRGRASSATRRGRRRPTSTSAAPTTGARCRSTTSAASSMSRPDRRPTTSTAPIASDRTCSRTACSRSTRGPGKRLWHFQTVHHDLWDLDNVSAPMLVTVRHNGQRVDAVAHAGKTGFLYVFNRVTGEPLWPIEERPVPKSDVPGEQAWPTQPFPTKPAPFARQTFTVDDVNPWLLTPEEYQTMRDRVAKARNEGHVHAARIRRTRSRCRAIRADRTWARRRPIRRRGWCSWSASIRSRSSSSRT